MRDLNDLFYFVQVVDFQGFASAGRELGIPKSTLSRRIALLEESLGVRLIQRSTRKFAVTDIGQNYYRRCVALRCVALRCVALRCVAMLVEANAAEEATEHSRAEPRGLVRISCPHGLAEMGVTEIVLGYMARNPRVTVHLETTNRRVDVVGEGLDIALRVRFPPLEDAELVMRVLGESVQRLVAHPSLLSGFPIHDAGPESLADLPSLGRGPAKGAHTWSLQDDSGRQVDWAHEPRLVTSDFESLHRAALLGIGIVQLPELMVRADIREGRLIEVIPKWRPRSGIIHAVFPSKGGLVPAVRGLIDCLAEAFIQR